MDLAREVAPRLRAESRRAPISRMPESVASGDDVTRVGAWTWARRTRASAEMLVRSVAWDADARCLAVTSGGLAFWTGTAWSALAPRPELAESPPHFVFGLAAGRWVVGGEGGLLAVCDSEGGFERIVSPDPGASLTVFDGDLEDIAVVGAAESSDTPARLYARVGPRWLKPVPIDYAASLNALARVDDETWIVAGRASEGGGFAALFRPLALELERLAVPPVRAFLAAAGAPGRATGVATGTDGGIVCYRRGAMTTERVDARASLSAATVDALGRPWAASAGNVWLRREQPGGAAEWRAFWSDASWTSPVISIFAGADRVVLVTVDGAMLEGRARLEHDQASDRPPPPG
jgi:hypothetical protein